MKKTPKIAATLAALGLLACTAGCIEVLAAGAGGYALGYLMGVNAPIENLCYKNGEPIDCADVPDGLVPS